ncbi:hypothetical protein K431DRAFT_286885 [Polychaeton citri CBS 116435]|uniref:Uncharacterized protein n=1 Tax=Polychaeton citri CBS 116435 TaxID=1314669 RepID=A0A9P4UNS5_9PEZI|nr:hypothetical protein K431DRAFT_286885 [Polychaeton citri CBS 116435]
MCRRKRLRPSDLALAALNARRFAALPTIQSGTLSDPHALQQKWMVIRAFSCLVPFTGLVDKALSGKNFQNSLA